MILAKTRYIETLFKSYVKKDRLRYIGWRSTDISNSCDKEYDEFLLFCHNNNGNYEKIIKNWDKDFPNLNIVNGHLYGIDRKEFESDNIIFHRNIRQNEFENLFNRCGLHLCLDEINNYCHNINQCCLSKSIPIIVNHGPMVENIDNDISFTVTAKKNKLEIFLGSRFSFDIESFKNKIRDIVKMSENTLEIMGKNARINSIKYHGLNDVNLKLVFSNIIKDVRDKPINKFVELELDELPKVSIVTLVHNRKHMFKLATYNFNTIDYPKDKLEWVIYDTSNENENVRGFLPKDDKMKELNIKYIHQNEGKYESIGVSRNRSVSYCSNEIVLFMDDDDYYPPESVKHRVSMLKFYNKKIVGCTILGTFNINKFISYIYTEPFLSSYHRRISPSTLCFYKDIITDTCRFSDESIYECEKLIKNIDMNEFKEINWEGVIVSIAHKNNLTDRKTPNLKPNGSHYEWGKSLFKFIAELDDGAKKSVPKPTPNPNPTTNPYQLEEPSQDL